MQTAFLKTKYLLKYFARWVGMVIVVGIFSIITAYFANFFLPASMHMVLGSGFGILIGSMAVYLVIEVWSIVFMSRKKFDEDMYKKKSKYVVLSKFGSSEELIIHRGNHESCRYREIEDSKHRRIADTRIETKWEKRRSA